MGKPNSSPDAKAAGQRLIIFVKAPRPGLVKTRLAKALGLDSAAQAYARLVERLLQNLARLKPVTLCYAPDDGENEIRPWLQTGWQAWPQGEGDLGERLQRAWARAFQEGADRVVVIGSDCPDITTKDIRQAWAALETQDVVLGPALDGGYWLIGLRRPFPELFQGIAWSSEEVLRQTLEKARHHQARVHLLRILTDVDTAEEWRAFLAGNKPGG